MLVWNKKWPKFIFKIGDIRVEIVRICIIWIFDLILYVNSTSTLNSLRWRLSDGESWRRFVWSCPRFKVLWTYQNMTYGLNLCICESNLMFEIRTDQNRLDYIVFKILNRNWSKVTLFDIWNINLLEMTGFEVWDKN